jgi:hypothetical protein
VNKLIVIVLAVAVTATACAGATLEIRLEPYGRQAWTTDSSQTVTVTRLAFLLSNFRLQGSDERWVDLPGQFAFIDPLQNRRGFHLINVPPGSYQQVAFTVGLDEKTNYADPSQWPADHPLNPLVNSLHWSWQGGYVFFALEGHYNKDAGFSLHLAKSPNQARITLAAPLDLQQDAQIAIALDVHGLLRSIHFATDSSATHSRDGDPLAAIFRANIARSFFVRTVSAPDATPVAVTIRALVATNATPYHFRVPAGIPNSSSTARQSVDSGRRSARRTALSRETALAR